MRIAIVTTYPPGKGSLNEYAYHFIRALKDKQDVSEIILLVDHLPAGESYPDNPESQSYVPIRIFPCWQFGSWANSLNIVRAIKKVQPDVVLFNIQFASFADKKIPAALGLLAPMLVKIIGPLTVVLLHNIMETVDLKNAGFGTNPIIERMTRFFGRLFTKMMLRADLVAVTIPKYVDILEHEYGANNVFLAPHGAFDKLPEPKLDLPDGPLQIMTFGKLGTYKKVDALIEAFDKIQKNHQTPLRRTAHMRRVIWKALKQNMLVYPISDTLDMLPKKKSPVYFKKRQSWSSHITARQEALAFYIKREVLAKRLPFPI